MGIEKALSLVIAKGRHFEVGDNGLFVSNDMIDLAINGNVEIINAILNSNEATLYFESSAKTWKINKLIKMLNLHESSYVSESALKNRVVHGIRNVALDPKNQLNLHSPISMDAQKNAARKSELSKDENTISIDTPSSKYMMQQQNMVGKQCIGITAVAIKTFFAKSAYYNEMLSMIPDLVNANQDKAVINLLASLIFRNPINGQLTLLSNVNVIDTIEKLSRDYLNITVDANNELAIFNENGQFNLKRCLKWLQKHSNRVDAAMELSGLLSASTDNAKELILSKINATSRFIDIYTVAIQCGATFDEISNIMTSPIFNAVSRVASNNIFKTYEGTYKLEKIINFYLNEKGKLGILPGVKFNLLKAFISQKINLKENETLSDDKLQLLLADTTFIESIIGDAYGKMTTAESQSLSDDGYELNNNITKNDWLCIANFLEEVVDRNLTLVKLRKQYGDLNFDQQIENLKKVRDIFIPATEEQNILGRMLGINQGLDTSGYKLYQNIWSIQNFVSKKIGQQFDLMLFLSNEDYRKDMINKYEKHKVIVNILNVITKVPHFNEMFNLLYDNHFILSKLSARYDLTQKYAMGLSPEYPLKEKEYKQIGYYINDLFLVSYLTSTGRKITIPKDIWYYEKGDKRGKYTIESTPVELNDLFGLASFKSYMENYVIPTLQNRKYRPNAFIRSLTRAINVDSITGEERSYYKLPLNMLTIDQTTDTKTRYEVILKGFTDIANDTFEGWKIADLFFVYNAIVNKDGFGKNSMTRIFEDLVDQKDVNSTMVSNYYEFISKIDENPELKQEFLKSIKEEDIRAYIKSNVPGTYIQSNTIWDASFDFTFRMPSLLGLWLANKPKVDSYIEPISSYSYGITNRSVLETLAQTLMSKYGSNNVQVHSQEWFDSHFNENKAARTNPAFIDNGIVYINSDLADISDVLHEYTHLVLATLKFDPKYQQLYYKLMEHIKTHPNYNTIAKWYLDAGFIGTDVDEEVFVKVLQEYFRNRIADSTETNLLISNEATIFDAVKDLLGSNLSGDLLTIMNSSPREIIRRFGSTMFDLQPDFDTAQQAIKWRIATQTLRMVITDEEKGFVKVKC